MVKMFIKNMSKADASVQLYNGSRIYIRKGESFALGNTDEKDLKKYKEFFESFRPLGIKLFTEPCEAKIESVKEEIKKENEEAVSENAEEQIDENVKENTVENVAEQIEENVCENEEEKVNTKSAKGKGKRSSKAKAEDVLIEKLAEEVDKE